MQSHEERADEMLRAMGGSLSGSEQRNVLRRLILAEDKAVDLQAEVIGLRKKVEGQDLLLRAYRLGTRPPERAFTLLEQAAKVLD